MTPTNPTQPGDDTARPQPTTVSLRVPAELYDRLQLVRIREHRNTMSATILAACWDYVERSEENV